MAPRLLRLASRTLIAAIVVLLLAASLVWAAQRSTDVIGSIVYPRMTASLMQPSTSAEQDLQKRADAYLQDFITNGSPAFRP